MGSLVLGTPVLVFGTKANLIGSHIAVDVDMQTRRSAPFPQDVMEKLAALKAAHADLVIPDQVGHVISIPPPKS